MSTMRRTVYETSAPEEEGLLLWRTAMARRTPQSTSAGTFGDAGAEAAAAGHVQQQRRRAAA
jgi:hypothetical protein